MHEGNRRDDDTDVKIAITGEETTAGCYGQICFAGARDDVCNPFAMIFFPCGKALPLPFVQFHKHIIAYHMLELKEKPDFDIMAAALSDG